MCKIVLPAAQAGRAVRLSTGREACSIQSITSLTREPDQIDPRSTTKKFHQLAINDVSDANKIQSTVECIICCGGKRTRIDVEVGEVKDLEALAAGFLGRRKRVWLRFREPTSEVERGRRRKRAHADEVVANKLQNRRNHN